MRVVRVAPVAGIPIVHELADGIRIEQRDALEWQGSASAGDAIVIRHEIGEARRSGMMEVLRVPPWCTFHVDRGGEPAALFHGVFGEVDRLLSTEVAGAEYRVRYAQRPDEPVIALQSELTAYSFAIAARGVGLIAHACAFLTSAGEGVLCPGVSGTGKTTLARLVGAADPAAEVLTDDRAVVTVDRDGARVWGSPWPGAANVAGIGSGRLTTVVFIRHGTSFEQCDVPPAAGFRRIVNTLSMPLWDPARIGRALEIVDVIVSQSRLVELTYPPVEQGVRWVLREVESRATAGAA